MPPDGSSDSEEKASKENELYLQEQCEDLNGSSGDEAEEGANQSTVNYYDDLKVLLYTLPSVII